MQLLEYINLTERQAFFWELINKPQSHNVCKTLKNGIIIYWEL